MAACSGSSREASMCAGEMSKELSVKSCGSGGAGFARAFH